MMRRITLVLIVTLVSVLGASACATRKYARNQVNERVTPLEHRAGELEETSRRNSQDIGKLNEGLKDVQGATDRAQQQADSAAQRADQANTRAGAAEQSVNDLRSNIDKYSLQNTATVNFRFDKYDLTPDAKAALDDLAGQIKDRSNFVLEIEGFADAVGSAGYNDQLTQKRAESVRRYLAEQHGIPLYRMTILGFGKSRAVADNHTRSGRAENRRVEVRLLTRNVSSTSTAQGGTSGQQ
jgi:outer membrane protein OmpA-like peptidoglycan-associated protein